MRIGVFAGSWELRLEKLREKSDKPFIFCVYVAGQLSEDRRELNGEAAGVGRFGCCVLESCMRAGN